MLTLFLEYYSCKKVYPRLIFIRLCDENLSQKLPRVSMFVLYSFYFSHNTRFYAELVIDSNLNICLKSLIVVN